MKIRETSKVKRQTPQMSKGKMLILFYDLFILITSSICAVLFSGILIQGTGINTHSLIFVLLLIIFSLLLFLLIVLFLSALFGRFNFFFGLIKETRRKISYLLKL